MTDWTCKRCDMLMQRCPDIVEHLDLQDIASFLNVTPKTISKIRKEILSGENNSIFNKNT